MSVDSFRLGPVASDRDKEIALQELADHLAYLVEQVEEGSLVGPHAASHGNGGSDEISLDWSQIVAGTPTTIAGYGITDAYTETEVDALLNALTFASIDGVLAYAQLPTGPGTWTVGTGGSDNLLILARRFTVQRTGGIAGIAVDSAAGNTIAFEMRRGGLDRWNFRGSSDAESGANAGTNFQLVAFDDAGVQIDVPLAIDRVSGGGVTFSGGRPINVELGNIRVTRATVGQEVIGGRITGDTLRRIEILAGGTIGWGSGSAATDLTLTRTGTGGLMLTGPTTATCYLNGAAGNVRDFGWTSAGVLRWAMRANSDAESGSNAGSTLRLDARADDGSFIDSVFTVVRALGGAMTVARPIVTVASVAARAGFRLPHGTAPSAPVDGDVWTTTAGIYVRVNGATVGPLT